MTNLVLIDCATLNLYLYKGKEYVKRALLTVDETTTRRGMMEVIEEFRKDIE